MSLPKGWKRLEVVRKNGINAGKVDIYVTSPGGKSFRSKKSLHMYLKEQKLPYNIDQFNFTTKNSKINKDVSLSTSIGSLDSNLSFDSLSSTSSTSQAKEITCENKIVPFSEHSTNTVLKEDSMAQTDASSPLITSCMELLSKQWLSDQTLHIYFEILNLNILKTNLKTMILDPAVVCGIKIFDDYSHLLEHIDFNNNNFLIMPITDANVLNDFEGSHWSVLFFDKLAGAFFHYDSLNNHNASHADLVMNKITKYLNLKNPTTKIHIMDCPKQINNYDCGVHSIIAIEVVVNSIISGLGIPVNLTTLVLDETELMRKRSCLAYVINRRDDIVSETIQSLMYKPVTSQNDQPNKSNVSEDGPEMEWNTVQAKKQSKTFSPRQHEILPSLLTCKNRFDVLYEESRTHLGNQDTILKTHESEEKNMKPLYQGRHIIKNKSRPLKKKTDVLIFADSQGRDMSRILRDNGGRHVNATGFVLPNASTKQVLSHAFKAKKGPLVIISGTNNLLNMKTTEIYMELEAGMKTVSANKQVILTTIPRRFDLPDHHQQHYERIKLNNYIKELAARMHNIHIIDLEGFRRTHFTRKGIHLNYGGKTKLSHMILNLLNLLNCLPSSRFTGVAPLSSDKTFSRSSAKDTSKQIIVTPEIQIIEDDMQMLINNYKSDASVGFAHCISADFGCEKQMSQGVAVRFKEQFGKPTSLDRCSRYLSYQHAGKGASIYSLITKSHYYGKPETVIYDEAFLHLTDHFKSKNLRTLICSPLGCIRDRISPAHFAANVVKFQRDTGALVKIITKDEDILRELRNGLSHITFIRLLSQLINLEAYKPPSGQCGKAVDDTLGSSVRILQSVASSRCSSLTLEEKSSACSASSSSADSSLVKCSEGGNKSSGVGGEVESDASTQDETVMCSNNSSQNSFLMESHSKPNQT